VSVESGIPEAVVAELRGKGHQVMRSRGSYGGYQVILIDWANGTLHGGTEPRKDGCAAGY
jgi:gamma-glutamyltranspeptidase/glutathione hydrolase